MNKSGFHLSCKGKNDIYIYFWLIKKTKSINISSNIMHFESLTIHVAIFLHDHCNLVHLMVTIQNTIEKYKLINFIAISFE